MHFPSAGSQQPQQEMFEICSDQFNQYQIVNCKLQLKTATYLHCNKTYSCFALFSFALTAAMLTSFPLD